MGVKVHMDTDAPGVDLASVVLRDITFTDACRTAVGLDEYGLAHYIDPRVITKIEADDA